MKNSTVQTFTQIAISKIEESKTNPRKLYDPEKMDELTMSIRSEGVITPILLRLHPTSGTFTHEIIFGSRRFRAASAAGLTTIPAMIRECSDKKMRSLQLIENIEREDLSALEESQSYHDLIACGYNVDAIAGETGKNIGHIYRRMALANLTEQMREFLVNKMITVGHAVVIAALPTARQADVIPGLFYTESKLVKDKGWLQVPISAVSIADLKDTIARDLMLSLDAASWDLNDANLVPAAGPCTTCPKRTGANPILFDDIQNTETDRCLDGTCFESKSDAHLVQIIAVKKEEGVDLVQLSPQYGDSFPETVLRPVNYTEATKKCPHQVDGINLNGPERGKIIKICRNTECKVHGTSISSRPLSSAPVKEDYWEVRAKRLEEKIITETRRSVFAAIVERPHKWTIPHEQLQLIAYALLRNPVPIEMLHAFNFPHVKNVEKMDTHDAQVEIEKIIKAKQGTPLADYLAPVVTGLSMFESLKEGSWNESRHVINLSLAAKSFGVDEKKIGSDIANSMRTAFNEKRGKAENKKAGIAEPASATPATNRSTKAKGGKKKPAKKTPAKAKSKRR